MCGIIGIVGREEVSDRLLAGLRRLEYRGYDSAGLCTIVDGRLERRRAEGLAQASEGTIATIEMPRVHPLIAPLVYAVPVQLLAYHVAVAKGTDVDQPRNLAKSVTVE